ncbi:phage tail protein [Bacteroides sp.]|uniref:phage tail protein n=1 Tax=Bacteroides sp. TaxID=29523 RepID=UPI0026189D21|nr:phage tail protein [Bacteroides sp.]MDD3038146.1 phage tail protein [Bacteroides sp.]
MAGEAQDQKLWPLPEFYFKVTITDVGEMSFKEVSGLDREHDVIEYRGGDDKAFTKVKMPGLIKNGDVTLKKGIFISDQNFWKWIGEVKLNTIKRRTVTISLLDEKDSPVQTWELANAWPKKITVEGFKADGNGVAMETLVLVHEGITIK